MSVQTTRVQTRRTQLKHELRSWEKEFAAINSRMPSRADIKACSEIAAKHKEYNQLRDILEGKVAPSTSKAPKKRTIPDGLPTTPSKRRPAHSTPSKNRRSLNATPSRRTQLDAYNTTAGATSPSQFATPTISRTKLGPTPQRNGIAIGLFDILTSATPRKEQRTVLGDIDTNVPQTPSRTQVQAEEEVCYTGNHKGSRTPMSAGKRFFLDQFVATPTKRKRDDEPVEEAPQHVSTPSFLRRDSRLATIEELEEQRPLSRLPWKRNGLVRSLSSMIRGMKERKEEEKREEEERLDEELDLLREMEAEEAGEEYRPVKKPKIQVADSQAVEMPLGPDQLANSDDEDDGQTDRPTRVWKKRGQKRKTKRVNMRPTRMKPSAIPEEEPPSSADELEAAVAETQADEDKGDDVDPLAQSGDESNYEDGPVETEPQNVNVKKRKDKLDAPDAKESKVKKAVRKVNEQAHANYRRLKIKSKNAKGKGRFGRG